MGTYTLVPALHDYEPSYEDLEWMREEIAYHMLDTQMEVFLHESSNDSASCSDLHKS